MAEVALPEIRLPWHNPHERPSDAMLVAHYPEPLPELVSTARQAIGNMGRPVGSDPGSSDADSAATDAPGLHETLAWRGLPWRWSWAYTLDAGDDTPGATTAEPQRAVAYLVPAPAAPVLCVPLTYEMYEAMPKGVATTFVRQGITLAREIGDCRWVEWTITQPAHLDEVLAVVRHKVAFLTGGAGQGG